MASGQGMEQTGVAEYRGEPVIPPLFRSPPPLYSLSGMEMAVTTIVSGG